jgi:hypothetical protein
MAEETPDPPVEQPAKRRPGRPRKNPAPAEASATPDTVAAEVAPAKPAKPAPKDPSDERIGQEVDGGYTSIVFPDGAQYRVEDGVIMEKVS